MRSLAGTVELLAPYCPPSLVSSRGLDGLRATAKWLPAGLSRCLYIECRPGLPDAVDLIVDVDESGREILAGDNPVIALDAALQSRAVWARVQSFARAWSDRGGHLSGVVSNVWLEFDLHADTGSPVPSVFVDFTDAILRRATPEEVVAAVASAALHLAHPLEPPTGRMLSRCVNALPAHAMLVYAGFMLARGGHAIRLCIMGLSPAELIEFLRAVHWPGDLARVAELTTSFAHPLHGGQKQPAIVHIDVEAAVLPQLGLEYPFARQPQLAHTIAERGFLGELVARQLLTADQRADLDRWPGYERRTMPHELWPSIFVRRVNHVKVVIASGSAPAAKVYLCAEHMPEHRATSADARAE